MSSINWEEVAAIGTLSLAVGAFLSVVKDPIKNWRYKPSIEVQPRSETFDPGKASHFFAVEEVNESSPLQVWLRLRIKNVGKSVARDVYARLVSVKRIENEEIEMIPFNPFRLRWTSSGYDWKYIDSLVKDEFEYLNMCTFIGPQFNDPALNPIIYPGIPAYKRGETPNYQGIAAGTNIDILRITYDARSQMWNKARFEYEILIGGSNFQAEVYKFIVECDIDNSIKQNLTTGSWIGKNLCKHIKLSMKQKGEERI